MLFLCVLSHSRKEKSMGERVLTEKERDSLVSMVSGLDNCELEVVVKNIPIQWLIYGTQCQANEMEEKLYGLEQIFKGKVG